MMASVSHTKNWNVGTRYGIGNTPVSFIPANGLQKIITYKQSESTVCYGLLQILQSGEIYNPV